MVNVGLLASTDEPSHGRDVSVSTAANTRAGTLKLLVCCVTKEVKLGFLVERLEQAADKLCRFEPAATMTLFLNGARRYDRLRPKPGSGTGAG